MSDLMIFSAGPAQVPAHIAGFLDTTETNIVDRERVPTLNYAGKVWSIALPDGSKTALTRRSEDGDVEPMQTIRAVVLDYAKQRGRTYYEGAFDPEKVGAPTCWSDDGILPDQTIPVPQSEKCGTCPKSVKGSKITEAGKSVTACSQHRHVVVLPVSGNMSLPPLRLKLAITSLFDKQSPELEKEGWRAFENYLDYLRGNGVHHTATLVTKMKFDANVNYPKVIFSSERWLEPTELDTVKARLADGSVEALLRLDAPDATPAIEAPKPAARAAPAPMPVLAELEAEAPAPTPVAAPKAAPPAPVVETPKAAKAAPKPAPSPTLLDLAAAAHAPAKVEAPKVEAPAEVTTDIPDDLKALLEEWTD